MTIIVQNMKDEHGDRDKRLNRLKCCICKKDVEQKYTPEGVMYWDQGENAEPYAVGRCCEECNMTKVLPMRMQRIGRLA
jgi:hypothetical protein